MKIKVTSLLVAFALAGGVALVAKAQIGIPPTQQSGPALQDGTWLNGLAGGGNRNFVSGLVAHAGGTQAAGLQLPANVALIQIDTVATTSDSVLLPFCIAGQVMDIANAGAQTLAIYANPNTNRATATTDTINAAANTSSYTLATNVSGRFFCPKNGLWKATKSG